MQPEVQKCKHRTTSTKENTVTKVPLVFCSLVDKLCGGERQELSERFCRKCLYVTKTGGRKKLLLELARHCCRRRIMSAFPKERKAEYEKFVLGTAKKLLDPNEIMRLLVEAVRNGLGEDLALALKSRLF